MTAANSKQSSNCDEKYHGAIKRFDIRCMKVLLRAGATVNNLSRAGSTVSKVSETEAFVNSVPRARFSVSNMPGRGAAVSSVPRTGATVNNVSRTGVTVNNVPGAGTTSNNVREAEATVSNVLGNCNNKSELTVTKKLPVEVLVLLFVAGEIFTQKQLKETVEEGIITKRGSGGDPRGKREDHEDVLRDLDHVAWEDWVESGGTAVVPPESFWKVSLKRQCRLAVREHLLKLDVNGNLFHRIPLLGLPQILTQYLLYNVSLDYDCDDNESSL